MLSSGQVLMPLNKDPGPHAFDPLLYSSPGVKSTWHWIRTGGLIQIPEVQIYSQNY